MYRPHIDGDDGGDEDFFSEIEDEDEEEIEYGDEYEDYVNEEEALIDLIKRIDLNTAIVERSRRRDEERAVAAAAAAAAVAVAGRAPLPPTTVAAIAAQRAVAIAAIAAQRAPAPPPPPPPPPAVNSYDVSQVVDIITNNDNNITINELIKTVYEKRGIVDCLGNVVINNNIVGNVVEFFDKFGGHPGNVERYRINKIKNETLYNKYNTSSSNRTIALAVEIVKRENGGRTLGDDAAYNDLSNGRTIVSLNELVCNNFDSFRDHCNTPGLKKQSLYADKYKAVSIVSSGRMTKSLMDEFVRTLYGIRRDLAHKSSLEDIEINEQLNNRKKIEEINGSGSNGSGVNVSAATVAFEERHRMNNEYLYNYQIDTGVKFLEACRTNMYKIKINAPINLVSPVGSGKTRMSIAALANILEYPDSCIDFSIPRACAYASQLLACFVMKHAKYVSFKKTNDSAFTNTTNVAPGKMFKYEVDEKSFTGNILNSKDVYEYIRDKMVLPLVAKDLVDEVKAPVSLWRSVRGEMDDTTIEYSDEKNKPVWETNVSRDWVFNHEVFCNESEETIMDHPRSYYRDILFSYKVNPAHPPPPPPQPPVPVPGQQPPPVVVVGSVLHDVKKIPKNKLNEKKHYLTSAELIDTMYIKNIKYASTVKKILNVLHNLIKSRIWIDQTKAVPFAAESLIFISAFVDGNCNRADGIIASNNIHIVAPRGVIDHWRSEIELYNRTFGTNHRTNYDIILPGTMLSTGFVLYSDKKVERFRDLSSVFYVIDELSIMETISDSKEGRSIRNPLYRYFSPFALVSAEKANYPIRSTCQSNSISYLMSTRNTNIGINAFDRFRHIINTNMPNLGTKLYCILHKKVYSATTTILKEIVDAMAVDKDDKASIQLAEAVKASGEEHGMLLVKNAIKKYKENIIHSHITSSCGKASVNDKVFYYRKYGVKLSANLENIVIPIDYVPTLKIILTGLVADAAADVEADAEAADVDNDNNDNNDNDEVKIDEVELMKISMYNMLLFASKNNKNKSKETFYKDKLDNFKTTFEDLNEEECSICVTDEEKLFNASCCFKKFCSPCAMANNSVCPFCKTPDITFFDCNLKLPKQEEEGEEEEGLEESIPVQDKKVEDIKYVDWMDYTKYKIDGENNYHAVANQYFLVSKIFEKTPNAKIVIYVSATETDVYCEDFEDRYTLGIGNNLYRDKQNNHNNINTTTITKRIKAFTNGECDILLLKGWGNSMGMNLQRATHLIIWNPTTEYNTKQVIGRVYRIGVQHDVYVHAFV